MVGSDGVVLGEAISQSETHVNFRMDKQYGSKSKFLTGKLEVS